MLKLIRLEFEKTRFGGYMLSAFITSLVLLALSLVVAFVPDEMNEGEITMQTLLQINFMLSQSAFIVFSSAVLARLVIEEYRTKTIQMLFTYPVQRKKLITAKLFIVACWTFGTITLSTLLISFISYLVNDNFHAIPNDLTVHFLYEHSIQVLASAAAASGISMIPLWFGMLRKSVPATIISAVALMPFLNSGSNFTTLSSMMTIYIALACVGAIVAWVSIRKVETADL